MSDRAKRICHAATFCVLLLVTASCASRHTLRTPADIAGLPASRGVNGGSFVAFTDWQYRGSDASFHYFWYFYNIDNSLRKSSVCIPRSAVILDFPEHAAQSAGEWVKLRNTERTKFYFILQPTPYFILHPAPVQ